jgi:hypothetical protein
MAGIVFSKASGVNDSIYGKSQEPIRALIESRVEACEKGKSVLREIYVMEKTDKFAEKFTYETALGNFQAVGEGGAYPQNSFQEGYAQVIEPDTWKNQFEVTMEMAEDAHLGKVKQRAGAFTLSYNRTRESFGAGMLMGGYSGSHTFLGKSFMCKSADGQNLFSVAHPSKTGGVGAQSNLYAGGFSYDNLLGVSPDTIIIPNDAMLKKAVFNAIGAEGEPESDKHSMNFQYGLWNVIIWPYLNAYKPGAAQSTPWILMDSEYNKAYYGAVWLDRVGLTVRSEIAGNDNNVFKGRARYMAGFNDWRPFAMGFAGSGGTEF